MCMCSSQLHNITSNMQLCHLLSVICLLFTTRTPVKGANEQLEVGPKGPCEDFYSFTCSKWDSMKTKGPIPESQDRLDERLKGILTKKDTISHSKAVKKAKSMYNTCLNTESRQKNSLLRKLQDFGGWPILEENWEKSKFRWEKLTASLRHLGYSFLIRINVHPDELNQTMHKIVLGAFQSNSDWDELDLQNYGRYIAQIVRYFQKNSNSTWPPSIIERQIRQILNFQAQLAKIPRVKTRQRFGKISNKTTPNVRITTAQLSQMTSRIFNWHQLFNSIFEGMTLSNHLRIIEVKDLDYINEIGSLLETTDPRTISNFLLWKFVEDVVEDGDQELVAINSEYHKNLSGNSPSKQDTCLKEVKGFMGYAVTNLIVNDIQPQNIIYKAREVAKHVLRTYTNLVSNASWINEPTRNNLLNKLNHLEVKMGYPEWILSNSKLDEYYNQVDIGNDHFANIISASKSYAFQELAQVNSAPDRNLWSITPLMTNAFYNLLLNTVYIPVAILQVPIVNPNWPMSMIFGSIGAVIGHEISHSFEDSQLYGDNDTSQSNIYDRQTECINKLHSEFCPFRGNEDHTSSVAIRTIYRNLCVNGLKTLHENVADFNGVRAAYKAFQTWGKSKFGFEDRGAPANLRGFTSDQLFFIGYGRMWCGSSKNFGLVHQLLVSYNAPNLYRLTGSLTSLSEEFEKTFTCQRKADRDASPSCKIW